MKYFSRRSLLGLRKGNGFSLVELLVVIVIIGILSGMGISQFKQYQSKARDAKRIQQFTQAVRLLKQYVTINGTLPSLTSNPPADCGAWRVSNKQYKEKIIEFDSEHGYEFDEDYFEGCYGFSFFRYPAGWGINDCPEENGDYIVFGVTLEQTQSGEKTIDDLGLSEFDFQCNGRHWRVSESRFGQGPVFGIFENGESGSP